MKLGCIADDFTGATDLAGTLRRSGASVRLHFGIPDATLTSTSDIEIIALKCRTVPADIAVELCCTAGHWLLARGATRLYWKYCSTFDSTAKGNIGPVAEALMYLTGQTQVLYCPAFPENGRSVFMGHLFVHEELLNESSLKDHPLTPMTDANLCRVLRPQVTKPVGLWNRIDQRAHRNIPKATHIIADALEIDDLARLSQITPDHVLLTGGSAFAMHIPSKLGIINSNSGPNPKTAQCAVILSGSCSQMTNRQVKHYQKNAPSFQLNPLNLARTGVKDCLQWLRSQPLNVTPLIYATTEPSDVRHVQDQLGIYKAGELVEQAMAEIAQSAYQKGIRRFVVAGGETSGAVTHALTVNSVEIGSEICPGVPWVFSNSTTDPIALALKSGNFGSESFFCDALAHLSL